MRLPTPSCLSAARRLAFHAPLVLALTALACQQPSSDSRAPRASSPSIAADVAEPVAPAAPEKPRLTRHPGAARVVAIGDVHGDLSALKGALKLAGLADEQGTWSGGKAVLVQTGDLLDRGDDEDEIMDLLHKLREGARAAGGDVVLLLGNHEAMNAQGDLRYVTPGGFQDFADTPLPRDAERLKRLVTLPQQARGRMAAFLPGGPAAAQLASYKTIAVVGDSVFVHGGVLPEHVDYGIDRLNAEVSAWLMGEGALPQLMQGERSPLWTRLYSQAETPQSCATLEETLKKLGVSRMVVGHTPQPGGITSACGEKVWRVDVGMAAHYGGEPAAWEVSRGKVRALTLAAAPQK